MAEIIIDMGSGNTCRNDKDIVREMIDALAAVDSRQHILYCKWQLFDVTPEGSPKEITPLAHAVFDFAYHYAKQKGYKTSASFFDDWSLDFLQSHDVPWLKIACRENLYKYIDNIDHRLIVSVPSVQRMVAIGEQYKKDISYLMCVPEYPANQTRYKTMFWGNLSVGISDHSPDLALFKRYQPWVYERHFKLEDSTGLDAGEFASTAKDLREIL